MLSHTHTVGNGEGEKEEGGWIKQQKEAREKMQLLVSAFSNSQQDQYEVFRRSSFPKSSVKKIMQVAWQEGLGDSSQGGHEGRVKESLLTRLVESRISSNSCG